MLRMCRYATRCYVHRSIWIGKHIDDKIFPFYFVIDSVSNFNRPGYRNSIGLANARLFAAAVKIKSNVNAITYSPVNTHTYSGDTDRNVFASF